MKNVKSLFALTILLSLSIPGCTGVILDWGSALNKLSSYELHNNLYTLLALKAEGQDIGLHFYRNPSTRRDVFDFYTEITGNEAVALSILSYSDKYDIPLPLSFSLAWGESFYKIQALNRNTHSVDRGLFQLNSKTFPFLKEKDFYNPAVNTRYGLAHLRFCLNEGKSELVALAIYNAGKYGVLSGTPYSTLKHVAKIMDYKEDLEDRFQRELLNFDGVVRLSNATKAE